MLKYYCYDLETLKNFFSFTGKFRGDSKLYSFEISPRKNERTELLSHLNFLQNSDVHMVGYNNLGFDYPIIHALLNNPYTFGYSEAFILCRQIISSQDYAGNRGFQQISMKERLIPQIDLFKINHFDNTNKRTSLKTLQFAMRSESVEDMPVKLGVDISLDQMDRVLKYNAHDVTETEKFLEKCIRLIDLRKELLDTGVLFGDVLNFSDVKIGTEYLVSRIGRTKCYSGSQPKQTFRSSIEYKDIILNKISYKTEPYQDVLKWFKEQIHYVKSEKPSPKLETKLANLDFHFGIGGVHASVQEKKYRSNSTHVIKDVDVSGMYVSLAVVNGFSPEHLGQAFSDAYKQLKIDRAKYKKGTVLNKVLKLAGNGAFGNSDNPFSPFYDPRMPRQITINGQLQLLQLVELLSLIPDLEIIQANTDGITVYMSRDVECFFHLWTAEWEKMTGLELEEVEYSKMFIKDVNNYLAITTEGEIKSKGSYWYPVKDGDYEGVWNKDFSMMCVQKVIEQHLIHGWPIEDLVRIVTNPFDFMLRYKTPAGASVFIGNKEMLKTVRYYVSTSGEPMKKIATPKGTIGQFKRKNKLSDSEFEKILKEI